MTDRGHFWLVLAGFLAMVLGNVGEDLAQWDDWSKTFHPKSIGALLTIISTALLAFTGGSLTQRHIVPPAARMELERMRELVQKLGGGREEIDKEVQRLRSKLADARSMIINGETDAEKL